MLHHRIVTFVLAHRFGDDALEIPDRYVHAATYVASIALATMNATNVTSTDPRDVTRNAIHTVIRTTVIARAHHRILTG
jgi:hypothetical protein